ncbi:MAG: acyl--CoA ligase [Chloroflexi bacterium]|nr:acyl--CoA ligase [Chloroflexota bacterium]
MILETAERIAEYSQHGWWGEQRLIDLFAQNVERTPNRVALVDPLNRADLLGDAPQRYTYTELAQRVNRLATHLLAAGIRQDHIIMIQLPNIAELAIVYLAAARIGAIVSPLPMQFRAHICWTSGTEAEPKGVPRSHNLWLTSAYTTVDGAELSDGAILLNPFPMVNMSGIGGMFVPWLLTCGTLVMHHPLNLGVFLQQIAQEEVNYTVAPPVLLNMLLMNASMLAQTNLSSLKRIGSGSAPLSAWMVTQWKERYGIDVLNFFGSNEGTAMVSGPREVTDPADRARNFPRYGGDQLQWTNRAAHGAHSKLVDPLTREVITRPDEPGELAIKGPTIFAGYYRRPELTAKAFDADGYFLTGDLFAITGEQHDRYRFVGRLKDLIVRGGMKISPEELENLIIAHPKVADVAVVGALNRRLNDETVCAVIVPKKDESVTLHDMVEYLKAKDIASYKLPRKLVVVDALPRNAVGKVLKGTLREQLQQMDSADDAAADQREPSGVRE